MSRVAKDAFIRIVKSTITRLGTSVADWNAKDGDTVLYSFDDGVLSGSLKRRDIATLRPNEEFTDEVVNFFHHCLMEKLRDPTFRASVPATSVCFFNTYFTVLLKAGFLGFLCTCPIIGFS
eukprot:tig00020516_g9952.t1